MNQPNLVSSRLRIRNHDVFAEAALLHTDGILGVREGIRDASKILSKEERYRAFTIFVAMAAQSRLAGGPGVPLRDFYEVCTTVARLSDRTAKTSASLLVHFRFARLVGDLADRRRRYLVPTDRTMDYLAAWGAPAYEALELLGFARGGFDFRTEMAMTFAVAASDYAEVGLSFFGEDPDFARVFGLLEGGSIVCMSAISAALHGRPAPSRSQIGERFAVSRAQVSNVVAQGRAAGLFTAEAKVTPSPRLLGIYLDCEANVLAFIEVNRERAREALRAAAQPDRSPAAAGGQA